MSAAIATIPGMRRNWEAPRAKVTSEGVCRSCGTTARLEAAHIVPRSRVGPGAGEDPRNILALCQRCHRLQHEGKLGFDGLVTDEEYRYVVQLVGPGEARRRIYGMDYL